MTGPKISLTPPEGALAPRRHPDAPAPGELLESHYEGCFGCGTEPSHGLRMRTRAGEGVNVTAEFEVTADHQGASGLAHGGLLAAALDEVLGGLNWMMQVISVTGRLETDFVRPVPVGTVLHLKAHVTAVSGRKIYCSATGRLGPDGPVAVRAAGLFIEVGVDHFVDRFVDDEGQEGVQAVSAPGRARGAGAFEVNL